jgi:uncharacterized surface protein with fasciclin (FAS1) repeats
MTSRLRAALSRIPLHHAAVLLGLSWILVACGTEAPQDASEGATGRDPRGIPDSMTVVRVLETDERFSTLRALLDSTGLDSVLAGPGPYTLFAPPNGAFEALPPGTMPTLLTDRPNQLRAILERHVLRERLPLDSVAQADTLAMLRGSVAVRGTGDSLSAEQARVVDGDVAASNGLVHILDRVLQPPSPSADEGASGTEQP